jgi:predicted DNA-binding transcriptional regulator AlpA
MSDVEYITKEELAARWKVTTRTIENMVAEKRCPQPVRLGYKTVRWKLADIEAHEKACHQSH